METPDPSKLKVTRTFGLATREGLDRTLYFFSYSGAMIVEGALPIIDGLLNETRFEILPPTRIGSPSERPTPQFSWHSVQKFFKFTEPPRFPLQAASFAALPDENGARLNLWHGPADELTTGGPELPCDTLLVVLHGEQSAQYGNLVEEHLLRPLLEWLRALTDQWWIGRSYEGICGALHFVAPIDVHGNFVGSPTPVVRTATGGARMKPITAEIWTKAADNAAARQVPGELALATDAKFMFVSNEFRSGCILACAAFEAARDRVLEENQSKLAALRCSKTDLLQHLSIGFSSLLGRNLRMEQPALYEVLRAFWIARGDAAHGRPVKWHIGPVVSDIERIDVATLTKGIDDVLGWIENVRR